jgi:RNA polymerase sigma factor (sigma-70 family)
MAANLCAPSDRDDTLASPPKLAADVALMHRAAEGDPAAQRAVIGRLMRRVQRLARVLLRHRDDASDASQASLLEILRSAASFRGDSSLERWADRIVVRTALRLSRGRRRDAGSPLEEHVMPSIAPRNEIGLHASEYLDGLPEAQRTVLILRCGYEYSIEEISEFTQASPNTVKDRLKRAREGVRRAIRREELPRIFPVANPKR